MRHPEYVSYHTADYEPMARRLRASLARFSLPHFIEHVDPAKSWEDSCRNRHAFINAMLDKHAPNPVVWLDCDCVVMQKPALFDELAAMERAYDVGLFCRPSGAIGGVIYADQTSRWFWDLCQKQQGDADTQMDAAYKIARADKLDFKVYPLGHDYQYCAWLMGRVESPLPINQVVIYHEMARTGKNHGRL